MAIIPILFPIIFFALIIFAPYYIILGGLKLLQIREISRSKVFVFYLSVMVTVFLTDRILDPFLINIFKNNLSRIFYIAVNNSIYLIVNFLFLKFYFRLSDKKLWQLFSYFIITGLILSSAISLLKTLSS